MPEGIFLWAALLCCIAGMGWFALAKEPHWRQVRGAQPLHRRHVVQLHALGSAGVAAAGALCLATDHVSMAFLVWVMALAAAALAVTFTLSWRPAVLAALIAWIPRR